MSATDELRRMLDERGVEWWPMHDAEAGYHDDRDTEFLVYGCKHVAHEWGCRLQVDMLTTEQAIAATLGSGTLTAEQVREAVEKHWHDLPAEYDIPESSALPEYSYDWQAIADELNSRAELGSEPPYDELLRCLENDWHIRATWDGLRKFWCIELTEEGVKLRELRGDAE